MYHFSLAANLHGINPKLSHVMHSPRRKSIATMPLSPLARTPATTTPSSNVSLSGRSTSPLTVKGNQVLLSPTSVSPSKSRLSSPLLRRALSPDRSGRGQKLQLDDWKKVLPEDELDNSPHRIPRSKSLKETKSSGKYS